MNVNKKLDRFKQWAGERMGGEVKTNVSDDFKAMEIEMGLRQEGLEKMQRAMNGYVKAISKRAEVESKEKTLPIAYLGGIMVSHGEEFDPDSEFGLSLSMFGKTQERVARAQESYVAAATATWLECLERSTVQMKEYQAARKKLDTRRLAYDTSLAKMQKAKKEDFRVEEELRSQRAKYEESEDDVHRRMEEIRDSDPESVVDLASFLDAQLEYHEQCREALLRLKSEWPAKSHPRTPNPRPGNRSRANTARSWVNPYEAEEEAPVVPEIRPTIRSNRPSNRFPDLPVREPSASPARPTIIRSTTYDAPSPGPRRLSPPQMPRIARVPSDNFVPRQQQRSNLRVMDTHYNHHEGDVFADDSTTYSNSSPDHSYNGYPISPATSHGSESLTPLTGKKAPPAPPSRLKKPPPPPPPAKRIIMT